MEKMECRYKVWWTFYSTVAAFFIFLSVANVKLFPQMKAAFPMLPDHSTQKYAIIFDGGSTGTRVHVFSFINNTEGPARLQSEFFLESKPGLSSYAHYPKQAAYSVQSLLDKAKSFIPKDKWYETPVVLKATAGLRLLPSDECESILEEVSHLFKSSPFYTIEDSVSVLDGEDEGLYAWFTLNFLLDHLTEPSRSVALLDLGGGSTQITFTPVDLDSIIYSPAGHVLTRKVQNRTLTIYSHSYLGYGLMSARLSILKLSMEHSGHSENANKLQSPCILPHTKATWHHGGEKYIVRGMESGRHGFEDCFDIAVSFLNDTIYRPSELWKREVYGISYYYDRAIDLGLITGDGGTVTVRQFMDAAKNVCSKDESLRPFECLDAVYITALLHHGLGFSTRTEIKLAKKIDGIETSWGLGAAYSLLT